MDPGNYGPQGGQKKSSIFAGLSPAPLPVPAPAPLPRPAAEADSAAILNQKMDALEKNIVSRLEKKIAEQFKAVPSALPSTSAAGGEAAVTPGAEALMAKISELERRLGDFGQQASLSASQLRNIEESKISARREIEDLLKAVREQQKYTELDHQMHAQLEKSWSRVEELEQKLMNFYASIMALQTEHKEGAAAGRSAENSFSAELRQAMEGLSLRLASLEEKAEAAAAGSSAQELKESVLAGLKDQVFGEMEAMRRQLGSELAGIKQENLALAGLFRDMLKENKGALEIGIARFSSVAAQDRMKAEELKLAFENMTQAFQSLGEKVTAAGKSETAAREASLDEIKNWTTAAAGSSAEALKAEICGILKTHISGEIEAMRRQFGLELAGIKQGSLAQGGHFYEILSENSEALKAGFAQLENSAGTLKANVLTALKGHVSGEMEAMRRQFGSELEGLKQESLAQAGYFKEILNGNKEALEAGFARLENYAGTLKADLLAALKGQISEEMEAMLRRLDSEITVIKQANLAQGGLFKEILKENKAALESGFAQFALSAEAGLARIDGARTAFEETSSALRARSRSMDDFFLAALKGGFDGRPGFGAEYANALASQSFLKALYSAMDEVSGALSSIEREAGSFVAGVDKERLEKTAGVSGMLMRKYFEGVGRAIEQIRTGVGSVERIKLRLNERFRDALEDRP